MVSMRTAILKGARLKTVVLDGKRLCDSVPGNAPNDVLHVLKQSA